MTASNAATEIARTEAGSVLVVDDDPVVRQAINRLLSQAGYKVSQAGTALSARSALAGQAFDVVLLDIGLPDLSGIELLREINRDPAAANVLMLTASNAKADMQEAMRSGASGYLRKPFDPLVLEAQVGASQHACEARHMAQQRCTSLETSLHDVEDLLYQLPRTLALHLSSAWDLRHVETGAHVRRIGAYSEVLALTLGVAPVEAATIGQLAVLHDVGKIAIPDAILGKPGKLSTEEMDIMKRHPEEGARILSGCGHPFLERAAVIALRHHERWDGSGYPGHLQGEACPLDARIVAVADVYDALGQPRCYKPGWSDAEIEAYFRESSGTLFEPRIVDALFACLPRLREIATRFPELDVRQSGVIAVASKAV